MKVALCALVAVSFVAIAAAETVAFIPAPGNYIVVTRNGNPTYVFSRVTRSGLPKNDITGMWTAPAPSGCTASVPTPVDLSNGVIGVVSITCTTSATPGYYSFNAGAYGLDKETAPPTQLSGHQSWYLQVTN